MKHKVSLILFWQPRLLHLLVVSQADQTTSVMLFRQTHRCYYQRMHLHYFSNNNYAYSLIFYIYLDCHCQAKGLHKFINSAAFGTTGFKPSPFLPPAWVSKDKVTENSEFYRQWLSSKAQPILLKQVCTLICLRWNSLTSRFIPK